MGRRKLITDPKAVLEANAKSAKRLYELFDKDRSMTEEEFVVEMVNFTSPQSFREELVDIVLDNQLSRAAAFGRAHRAKRENK